MRQDIAAVWHPADLAAVRGVTALGERGRKIVEPAASSNTGGERARLRRLGKWTLLHRGEFRLSVQSPAKLIDRPQGLWRRLPMFWQVQLVGWGLFGVVDLISQRLIFHDLFVASLRTGLIVACLVLISAGMGSVHTSHRLENRLGRTAAARLRDALAAGKT
jgi:hypothetical protein